MEKVWRRKEHGGTKMCEEIWKLLDKKRGRYRKKNGKCKTKKYGERKTEKTNVVRK
jgi:hypothetical protein